LQQPLSISLFCPSNRKGSKAQRMKARVIYIAGYGRSGSTVLDTILGNHPDIESVGELAHLCRSGYVNNEYCACGKQAKGCLYWSQVWDQWRKLTGIDDPFEYIALQEKFERIQSFPRIFLIGKGDSFKRYAELTRGLYLSIQKVSGKAMIVDSSKNPARLLALHSIDGVDVRATHLVRDGRGVAWSLMKSWQKDVQAGIQCNLPSVPVRRTAMRWVFINLLAGWVMKRANKDPLRICYEELTRRPEDHLRQLRKLLDVDMAP